MWTAQDVLGPVVQQTLASRQVLGRFRALRLAPYPPHRQTQILELFGTLGLLRRIF